MARDESFPFKNLPVCAFDCQAQGFITPLARRRSSCPPPSSNLDIPHPIDHATISVLDGPTKLSATALSASRVPPPPEGHQNWSSGEAHRVEIILTQQNCRRVSNYRLNRVDSQVVEYLKGGSSPTPAGKTPPHSKSMIAWYYNGVAARVHLHSPENWVSYRTSRF